MVTFAHNAKKPLTILVATVVIWLSILAITPVYAGSVEPAEQSLLVTFAPGTSESERRIVAAELGGRIVRWMDQIATAEIALPATSSRSTVRLAAVSQRISVLSIESDLTIAGTPIIETFVPQSALSGNSTIPASPVQINDPDFNNPQKVYAPQIIEAPMAWSYEMGSPSVIVAILDTGIDSTHPDLVGKVLVDKGYDFVNDDNDPADDHGHGTHVAGIVAATSNNGVGSAGVCPGCSVMAVKVLDHNNVGSWSDVVSGILYSVDNGANVINLSLGGSSNVKAVKDAIDYAVANNVVVVAAAGNGRSGTPFYPAALDNVIGVSATRNDDTIWSLSNFGEENVDVAAPGYAIFSTYNDQNNYYNGYMYMSGTSMAAPHVAGLAGLLLSQDSARSVEEVQNLISSTADDLGDAGLDPYFGAGRINFHQALLKGRPQPKANAGAGGFVWMDENGNGVRDGEEQPGVMPVTIYIQDSNGTLISETTPAENGIWQVENLYPGSYVVKAESDAGMILTSPQTYQIQLADGELRRDLDFGTSDRESLGFTFQIFVPSIANNN